MAYISEVSSTYNSITVQLSGMQTSYEKNDRICEWYIDGSYKGSFGLSAGASSSRTFTFTGLKSSTSYTIEAYVSATEWSDSFRRYISTAKFPVDKWSWSSSNGSAGTAQTRDAYSAVTGYGNTINFSYLVWNDMCAKVREIRPYAGVSDWNNWVYGLSYSETLMSSSNKVLTAKRFNSLRYNIGANYSTGIAEVSTGDKVYGHYFVTLVNKINEWIDTF